MVPFYLHLELQDQIPPPVLVTRPDPSRQCLKQLTDFHKIWHKCVSGYYHDLEHYFWDLQPAGGNTSAIYSTFPTMYK
jgi:hypothetical protein